MAGMVLDIFGLGVGLLLSAPGKELLMQSHPRAKRVVLFSKKTPASTGEAVFTYYLAGFKPLPVKVEDCPSQRLISDLAHANIFGQSEEHDNKQLERLMQAIRP
jgi:hypothetical protein